MSDLISRREFFRRTTKEVARVGGALILGEALTACSPSTSKDSPPVKLVSPVAKPISSEVVVKTQTNLPESTPVTNEFLKPITRAEIRNLINNLKEGPSKDFIKSLGLPFFQDILPKTITIGGINMPFYPTQLTTSQEPGSTGGRSTIRQLTNLNPEFVIIKGSPDTKVKALVPYLYGEGETTSISVPFQDGRKIVSGIGAYINLNFPKDIPLTRDLVSILPGLRTATLAKEVMGIAINAGMMASMRIEPPFLDNNRGGKIEVLSQTFADLMNQEGKFSTYMDWIPFVLGIKALQDNSLALAAIRSYRDYNSAVGEILRVDFGNQTQNLIPNAARWIRGNLALMNNIDHIGTFDQEP